MKAVNQSLEDLSDVFGKASTQILNDLVNGCTIEQIIKRVTDKRILKKKEDIAQSLHGTLNNASVLIIKTYLEPIHDIDAKISELDAEIANTLQNFHKEDLKIPTDIPGVGYNACLRISFQRLEIYLFSKRQIFTSWAGLAPSSHSSGGKVKNGRIGRTGNRYLKRILVQVARYRREDEGISARKVLQTCDDA